MFIILSCQEELCNFRYSTHQILTWVREANVVFVDVIQVKMWRFAWWKLSFKSKCGGLRGGSYTAPSLVLFSNIFDRVFDFIFLAFEPYHMVDPPSVLSSLSVFGVSFPIKGPVQSQFQLLILRYTFD